MPGPNSSSLSVGASSITAIRSRFAASPRNTAPHFGNARSASDRLSPTGATPDEASALFPPREAYGTQMQLQALLHELAHARDSLRQVRRGTEEERRERQRAAEEAEARRREEEEAAAPAAAMA